MNQNDIRSLLTTGNPKIEKGAARGYLTSILHLAPAWLSGYNMCPMATAGCAAACLNTAGRGGIFRKGETTNVIQNARIRKTIWFMERREEFMVQLIREIRNAIKLADRNGLIATFRLNGTSDIRWETIPVETEVKAIGGQCTAWYPNIMTMFPEVQFYDYTKIANRRDIPANYHLTFSLAEDNHANAFMAMANGMNVAAVFKTLPEKFNVLPANLMSSDHQVINGDITDLRFLDPVGVIVGLKAKGKAKKDTSGFVQLS